MAQKRIVVTGATSMMGIALIEAVLEEVDDLYAVIRPDTSRETRLPVSDKIHVIPCEVGAYATLPERIPAACDVFYHFAWQATGSGRNRDISLQCANITYTIDALRSAHRLGCRKFVGAGSQAEYGLLDREKISPDAPVHPIQPYGVAKYAAGRLSAMEAASLGLDHIWVRIFSVYGEYDKDSSMISTAIWQMLAGERTHFTPAQQRWDYLYSKDAGKAFALIGEYAVGSRIYCLGYGAARPLRDYIMEIYDQIRPGTAIGIGDLAYPPNCVMNLCADISSLTADTGWKPETEFREGIQRTISVFRDRSGD